MTEENKTSIYEDFIKASKEFKKPKLNKKVQYGKTNFAYADLAEILSCIKEPLLNHGFIIVHEFGFQDIHWYIKTYLQYKDGEIIGKVGFPIDFEKQTMQDIGKQITYLKRYSLAALCSLAAEEDNDAVELQGQPMHAKKDPTSTIKYLLQQLPKERQIDFLGYLEREFKVTSFKDVPINQISKVERMLEAELMEQMAKDSDHV